MSAPVQPYNLDAEIATIASALVNHGAAMQVTPWLTADRFFDLRHVSIWNAVLKIMDAGGKPNYLTVKHELERCGELDRVGGMDYLLTLTELPGGVYSNGIEDYATIVDEAATDRQLLQLSHDVARIAQSGARAERKIGDVQQVVSRIQTRAGKDGLQHISVSIQKKRDQLAIVQAGGKAAIGTLTNYRDLDKQLGGGLQATDLIILAARPSVGKTALAMNIAYNVANFPDDEGRDRDVLFFSLEMNRDQLTDRLVAMISGIDAMRVRQVEIRRDELDMYLSALEAAASLSIFIDDTPGVGVPFIRNKVYQHIADRGQPALICIDYLQLMVSQGENRVQEVSRISRELKGLAKEFKLPMLALSQLSRAVEGRASSHVPMLSDLRESGSIEQDADIVMFIYREELYDKTTDKKGIAEIHIAKSRNGPIGVVPMRFETSTTRFETLSYRSPEGY